MMLVSVECLHGSSKTQKLIFVSYININVLHIFDLPIKYDKNYYDINYITAAIHKSI